MNDAKLQQLADEFKHLESIWVPMEREVDKLFEAGKPLEAQALARKSEVMRERCRVLRAEYNAVLRG